MPAGGSTSKASKACGRSILLPDWGLRVQLSGVVCIPHLKLDPPRPIIPSPSCRLLSPFPVSPGRLPPSYWDPLTRWKFDSLLDVFRRNMAVDAEILDLVSGWGIMARPGKNPCRGGRLEATHFDQRVSAPQQAQDGRERGRAYWFEEDADAHAVQQGPGDDVPPARSESKGSQVVTAAATSMTH